MIRKFIIKKNELDDRELEIGIRLCDVHCDHIKINYVHEFDQDV